MGLMSALALARALHVVKRSLRLRESETESEREREREREREKMRVIGTRKRFCSPTIR